MTANREIKQTQKGIQHLEKETSTKVKVRRSMANIIDEYCGNKRSDEDFTPDLYSISGRRLG